MSGDRFSRFEKLERQRDAEVRATDPRSTSVESRFGPPDAAADEEARGGGQGTPVAARFEERPESSDLRLLDLDQGQSFVRCAICRADSHATATQCAQCEADLLTREQRSFNEAFWKRRLEEQAEEQVAIERMKAARGKADSEMATAIRQRYALEDELRRRQALGLPLDEGDDVSDPVRAGARWVGGAIGRRLARHLPGRNERLLVVGIALASIVALAWAFASVRFVLLAAFLIVIVLLGGGGRARFWWRRY